MSPISVWWDRPGNTGEAKTTDTDTLIGHIETIFLGFLWDSAHAHGNWLAGLPTLALGLCINLLHPRGVLWNELGQG